jgi:alkylhydroperoxidase family enzyme
MMARLPYIDRDMATPVFRELLDKTNNINLWRMLGHDEVVSAPMYELGITLLRDGVLDPHLREIVILTIGRVTDCEYEVYQHSSLGRLIGLPEAKIVAACEGRVDCLTRPEAIAVRFAEELQRQGKVSHYTFADAQSVFSHRELVELTILCGYYLMAAGFLRTFEVELENQPVGQSVLHTFIR